MGIGQILDVVFERLSWLEINLPLESDQVTQLQDYSTALSTSRTAQEQLFSKDRKSVESGNIFTHAQFDGRTYYISFIMTRRFFRCLRTTTLLEKI